MVCVLTGSLAKTATVNSDAQGHATLNQYGGSSVSTYFADGAISINVTGSFSPVTFTLTSAAAGSVATPAPAANSSTLKIISGNNQSVALTTTGPASLQQFMNSAPAASFAPLDVLLSDGNGNPVANAAVAFACTSQVSGTGCYVQVPDGLYGSTASFTTNAQGHAIVPVVAGPAPGPMTVTATFKASNVAFTLTTTGTLGASGLKTLLTQGGQDLTRYTVMTIVSGDNQQAVMNNPDGSAHFLPLAVTLQSTKSTDPKLGLSITFVCAEANGTPCPLTPSGQSAISVVQTGPQLLATLTGVRGVMLGPFTVTASFPTGAAATFHLTALPVPGAPGAEPQGIGKILEGGAQSQRSGQFGLIRVQITAQNKLLVGLPVSWACAPPPGGACVLNGIRSNTLASQTNGNGVARLESTIVQGAAGTVTLSLSSPQLQSPVIIKLTIP
jgi:hypothetical protein